MKVKALLELLADYEPETDVLLVRDCPGDGVVSLLPDGQESCRKSRWWCRFCASATSTLA